MTRRNPILLPFLFPSLAMASLPLVDFDRMGTVGLAGSFAGLDLFANTSVSFDPSTSSLLTRNNDGALTLLGSTNTGGSIAAACSLGDTIYFAGSFSSIGGVSAQNVASYSYSSSSFSSLGSNGPNGDVAAVYCDASHNRLWVGGQFTSPAPSVAVWDTKASSWSAAPFGGLSGAGGEVLSITANASQSSLIFAGSFVTAFGNGSRVLNGTNNPNVPFSSGATPFSSSLVPVPLTGDKTQIDAAPSSTQNGFSDINAILCPAGADGPGNTWLAQDGNKAVITVRKFTFLAANGIRIGNTFVNGRGTTGFSVATIPDNAVRTLQYVDPITGQNQTCSTDCPLLSDPSVPYQDFLFTDDSLDITGFQLTLSEWKGSGPGLHLLQLLSPGAFASSVASQNGQSCFAPSASNATRTGTWTEKDVITDIPGTVQPVLVASVDVGTPSTQAPTFTWMPYVSASGVYAVNLLIPGCTVLQDCALRTSVKVTVFPGGGQSPFVSTISQANTDDQSVNLYTGPVVPTSESFSMTVTMALADAPEGNGQNGKYELVADRVQLTLQSANLTSSGSPGGTNGTSVGSQTGFGVFEWPLDGQQGVNASGVLPNSSLTTLDAAGFNLLSALGTGNAQASSVVNTVVQAPSGVLFIGGRFALTSGPATGASNVVMFKDGALVAFSNNGLDGMVTSLALHDNTLFIGGSFSDTANPTTNGKLRGVAAYDIQANQWASLDGGLAGTVASITLADPGMLLAAGNFSTAADGKSEDGLAAWNISGQNWANSGGFLKGQLSLVSNATVSSNGASVEQVVAGSVATSLRFGASGFALLQNNGDNDEPKVTPIGVDLQSPLSTNSTSSTNARRHLRRAQGSMSWFHRVGSIFKRQTPAAAQLAPLPSPASTSGPAVLAGAYWTNTTTSRQTVILGGNFEFTTTSGRTSQNIAFYDPQTTTIEALNGNQLNGTVRSLLVVDDDLYIGGTFTVQGTEFTGFSMYNLARGEWDTVGSQSVRAASGDVVVRSITVSPSQENTIIVAGTFTQVGDTTCRAVCEFDTKQRKWNALGNGIQGEAATVSYAGDKRDTIIVAGSLALADGTVANVAQFAIANSSWSGVGGSNALPGPVTAMEVNNGNASSIFAAGKSSDGSFLSFWNGQTWTAVNSGFAGTTDVAQLTMVPLQNTHAANGVIEPDRMLWISGALSDPSFGSASSALFDGENIIPYVMTADPSGNPGVVASLFHSFSTFSFTQRHFLAVGIVILISIAIAAGVVFLLALIGILWTLFARKDDKTDKFDPAEIDDDDSMTHRPSSLLEHINAATRTTIIGQSPFGEPSSEKGAEAAAAAASADPFGPDASNFARAETPSDAIGGILAGEEASRPAHARYSFDGKGEGELPMSAGQEIEILDDGDAAWWYARDARTGKEGVVPAAYVY